MDLQILLKLTEYQGSQNKAHVHNKGSYKITGTVGTLRHGISATSGTYGNGALSLEETSSQVSALSYSGNNYYKVLKLDTSLDSGSGFTGNSGQEGATAKPPTIAIMWILRFI